MNNLVTLTDARTLVSVDPFAYIDAYAHGKTFATCKLVSDADLNTLKSIGIVSKNDVKDYCLLQCSKVLAYCAVRKLRDVSVGSSIDVMDALMRDIMRVDRTLYVSEIVNESLAHYYTKDGVVKCTTNTDSEREYKSASESIANADGMALVNEACLSILNSLREFNPRCKESFWEHSFEIGERGKEYNTVVLACKAVNREVKSYRNFREEVDNWHTYIELTDEDGNPDYRKLDTRLYMLASGRTVDTSVNGMHEHHVYSVNISEDEYKAVAHILKALKLSPLETKILAMRCDGRTKYEIAKELCNGDKASVRKLLKRIQDKARKCGVFSNEAIAKIENIK